MLCRFHIKSSYSLVNSSGTVWHIERDILEDDSIIYSDGNKIKTINQSSIVTLFDNNMVGTCITGFAQSGNVLLIVDSDRHCIRQASRSGEPQLQTIAGVCGSSGDKTGSANEAQFKNPVGIIIFEDDAYYISDFGNNEIKTLNRTTDIVALALSVPFPAVLCCMNAQGTLVFTGDHYVAFWSNDSSSRKLKTVNLTDNSPRAIESVGDHSYMVAKKNGDQGISIINTAIGVQTYSFCVLFQDVISQCDAISAYSLRMIDGKMYIGTERDIKVLIGM